MGPIPDLTGASVALMIIIVLSGCCIGSGVSIILKGEFTDGYRQSQIDYGHAEYKVDPRTGERTFVVIDEPKYASEATHE